MDKSTLLVVDDEPDLLAELKPLLERSGYIVHTATDGIQALELVNRTRPDLIILDVLMPRLDGRETLRRLRHAEDWTPVILLTQVGTPAERAHSLFEGADDYINKPFNPMELIARVQAVLRRVQQETMSLSSFRSLSCGDIVLNRQSRQMLRREETISLTSKAFSVLEYLMLHPGESISRDRLLDEVWGWASQVETRVVDMRIAEIRRALDDDASEPIYIETEIGYGYRFVGPVKGQ